ADQDTLTRGYREAGDGADEIRGVAESLSQAGDGMGGDDARRPGGPDRTRITHRTGRAFRTLRAEQAGRAFRTFRTGWTFGACQARWTHGAFRARRPRWALGTSRAFRTCSAGQRVLRHRGGGHCLAWREDLPVDA